MEIAEELVNRELAQVAVQARRAFDQAKSTGRLKPSEIYEFEKERVEKEKRRVLAEAGIFARYSDCAFELIERRGIPPTIRLNYEQVKKYADKLDMNLKTGAGLVLRGQIGTMKTSLAVASLRNSIENGMSGFFITMPSLMDTIFTLKERNPEEWVRFEQKLRTTQLLVIDDLGAEYQTGWVLNKVDAIISERYNRCLPMIITTNLTGEQMRNTYADRVIDRLRSTCEIVTFNGQSLRASSAYKG